MYNIFRCIDMRRIPDWTVHSSHTQFCIYNVDTSLFDYLDFIIQPLDLRCWVHFIFTSHDVVLILTHVNFIHKFTCWPPPPPPAPFIKENWWTPVIKVPVNNIRLVHFQVLQGFMLYLFYWFFVYLLQRKCQCAS